MRLKYRFVALAAASTSLLVGFLLSTPLAAQPGQGQRRGNDHDNRNGHAVQRRLRALETQLDAVVEQLSALTTRVATLESLPGRVTALEARAAALEARATTLEIRTAPMFNANVDCAGGQTIAAALAQTAAHTGTVQLTISGVCNESVVVTRPRMIIQGAGPGATIQAPPGSTAVRLATNGGVTPSLLLRSLTIAGGQTGVSADGGANVQLLNVELTGNVNGVALLNRSEARLTNTTIDLPAAGGGVAVDLRNGAFAAINGGAIRNHTNYALQLQNGAVADVVNTQITDNQNGGGPGSIRGAIGLYGGSSLRLTGTAVDGNVGNGVFVAMGSVLYLENGVSISGNTGHGISASDGAVVGKFFVTTNVHINANGGYGISCSAAPGLGQLYGFPSVPNSGQQPIDTAGNGLGGINATCHAAPVP
jgi:hypothetical protein